jgi:polysaccharide biosynthesis protein PslF
VATMPGRSKAGASVTNGAIKPMRRSAYPTIGLVSSYPPTRCGLATFSAALRTAVAKGRGSDAGLGVVSLIEKRSASPRPEVAYEHVIGDWASLYRAAAEVNTSDVALLQHEYGIYGGPDGAEILALMSHLEIPVVVALHTILKNPSPPQRVILEQVVDRSDRVIVMSATALELLAGRYDVDARRARVIPHGANPKLAAAHPSRKSGRPVVLTWGLIGPDKGLKTAIRAFSAFKDLPDAPRYRIVGGTHPKVRAVQGDAYLSNMMTYASALGLDDVVEFDGRYLDTDTLLAEIRDADIVLIPYDSTEQVTSGVLVEALAAGKPIVATAFPHATELLGNGAGVVVSHADPGAMQAALQTLLTDPVLAARMAEEARCIGAGLHWPVVAAAYESTMAELVAQPDATSAQIGRRARQQSDAYATID